ncbi:MAG: TetR/AcrR family transcriptional regulator [Clostridia bacterium]|nr:TetR/AcrR family transcriptional regulator [Clostridia bacterium]
MYTYDTLSQGGGFLPSNTFLKLPQEKREKFIEAAKAEFARVPYTDASINQMIRSAGIPRGSFYMYFKDKEELFRYLVSEYIRGLEGIVQKILAEENGDLLATFLSVFDYVQRTAQDPEWRRSYKLIIRIATLNSSFLVNTFMEEIPPAVSHSLMEHVDRSRLNLKSDEDLTAVVRILQSVSGPAFRDAILSSDTAAARQRFVNTLDILARGISK